MLLLICNSQDLPDVQELIAEVNAEKYSLQAAAILGEATAQAAAMSLLRQSLLLCLIQCLCFRHRRDGGGSLPAASEGQHGKSSVWYIVAFKYEALFSVQMAVYSERLKGSIFTRCFMFCARSQNINQLASGKQTES